MLNLANIWYWQNIPKIKEACKCFELDTCKVNTLIPAEIIAYFQYIFPECRITKVELPSSYELKIYKGRDFFGNSYSLTIYISQDMLNATVNVNNHISIFTEKYPTDMLLGKIGYDLKLKLLKGGVRVCL